MKEEVQAKIQKLQLLEENMHALLAQKQKVQAELMELESAEAALNGETAFKIIGNIMVEQPVADVKKELDDRLARFKVRLASLEKQEASLKGKAEALQQEIMKSMGDGNDV